MRKKHIFFSLFAVLFFFFFIFWVVPQKGDALLPQQGHIVACYIQSPYTHERGLPHTIIGGFDYLVTGDELEELLNTFNDIDFKKALYPRSGSHQILPGRSWELCFEYEDSAGDMGRITYTDDNFMEIELRISSGSKKTRLFLTQSTAFLDFLVDNYS